LKNVVSLKHGMPANLRALRNLAVALPENIMAAERSK
jgi:hypothetical protein